MAIYTAIKECVEAGKARGLCYSESWRAAPTSTGFRQESVRWAGNRLHCGELCMELKSGYIDLVLRR